MIMANGRELYSTVIPEWNSEQIQLKNLVMKSDIPIVAKVIKGQFSNLGVSKIPLRKLHPEVFVHSIKTGVKVLAHSVQRYETKDGLCRIVPLDQRLSIPISYKGWFEILSEDGRSSRPIETVQKLAKELPNKCLVRQNVKGFLANSEGKLTSDNSNIIPAGEQLILSGEITTTTSSGERLKFLKCTDSRNNTLFLSFDQRGLFTPIAGPNDVAGVFTIRDILSRFRLPMTVKLVQGVWPKVDKNRFTGLTRFDWAYTDETAFMCPIDKGEIRITPVPTDVPFKLVTAKNMSNISLTVPCQDMITKCNKMVANYNNTIHLIISVPESVKKNRTHSLANIFSGQTKPPIENKNGNKLKRASSREDILHEEVDDLYQYLREGKLPPKSKFTYESDEESYFEEPAYEPLDDFRSRLAMIDKGKPGYNNSKYKPTTMYDSTNTGSSPTYVRIESKPQTERTKEDSPPPVPPPRRFSRSDSAPQIIENPRPTDSSSGSGSKEIHRIVSEATLQRKTKLSKHKDKYKPKQTPQQQEDNRSSRTGSSGTRRHSLNTLYL
ncbi:uncharacterized protein LOC143058649 [Mytilus galloprovincialis]|uniref:CABIT domain-containing protein n=1 Tax=Mytilus edulis TaxID=6550 RepID=A0A8S3PTA4_MYTED|nr:unnamed protein product [Mytilus edulis]